MAINSRILLISDLHAPFGHPDTIKFLKAIKLKYKPDKVISVGDEVDYHAISFHDSNPDLLSPGLELEKAIDHLKPIMEMFPDMDVMESNHGSMVYRKGVALGLPRHVFKSYRDILTAPKGWKWHGHLVTKMSDGASLYTCHSKGADVLKVSQAMGMSVVQGHHHEKFELRYWANSLGLYFAINTGCMIDDETLAFNYNKVNLKRPIVGHTIILNGLPKLLPMVLNKSGRWTGDVS